MHLRKETTFLKVQDMFQQFWLVSGSKNFKNDKGICFGDSTVQRLIRRSKILRTRKASILVARQLGSSSVETEKPQAIWIKLFNLTGQLLNH